jgi:hypothetical protein
MFHQLSAIASLLSISKAKARQFVRRSQLGKAKIHQQIQTAALIYSNPKQR